MRERARARERESARARKREREREREQLGGGDGLSFISRYNVSCLSVVYVVTFKHGHSRANLYAVYSFTYPPNTHAQTHTFFHP